MSPIKNIREYPVARSYTRFSYLRDLSFTYEGHGQEVPLPAPDLSARGMFIHTTLCLPEGAVLRVRFRLFRSHYEVKARGEVRYSLPGVGVGVEFVEISPEAQQAIEEELGSDEVTPPTPPNDGGGA